MKKTITHKDGSTEVIEGTAEEIAEYERKIQKGSLKESPPKKKEILKGKSLQEYVQEYLEKNPPVPWYIYNAQHSNLCDLTVAQRGWWSVVPPRCTCGLSANANGYTIITTTTTNTLEPLSDSFGLKGENSNGWIPQ